MLVALDTNIIVYAAGLNDRERSETANEIRVRLGPERTLVATQVLGELYNVLVANFGRNAPLHTAPAGY